MSVSVYWVNTTTQQVTPSEPYALGWTDQATAPGYFFTFHGRTGSHWYLWGILSVASTGPLHFIWHGARWARSR